MSNPRDTGRYDAFTDSYVDRQVRVDFAWGNIPMQPNDDRGMSQLDETLDSHIIATSGYEGFPAFITGGIYDDTIPNVAMPNIIGMTQAQAETALTAVGLNWTIGATVTEGATSENNGKVAQQTTPGTLLNAGDTVLFNLYENPLVTVPNIVGMTVSQAGATLYNLGLVGDGQYTQTGATQGNNQKVKSSDPVSGTQVSPGSTVHYQVYSWVDLGIAGIRADSGDGVNYRYLYLRGRNSGLGAGHTIELHNTGVANYDRMFDVVSCVPDDAFNTGGEKLVIRNGLMDGTGGDVTNTGTYTVIA